jgi:hypothetical protein
VFDSDSHGDDSGRETDMDSNFTIKPRAGVQKTYAPRDPVAVREAVETDLDATKTVAPSGDPGSQQRDPRHDHAPHDVVADPESREVINRENDVSALTADREHPDQALLRQRAYRPAEREPDHPPAEPHANIKA